MPADPVMIDAHNQHMLTLVGNFQTGPSEIMTVTDAGIGHSWGIAITGAFLHENVAVDGTVVIPIDLAPAAIDLLIAAYNQACAMEAGGHAG